MRIDAGAPLLIWDNDLTCGAAAGEPQPSSSHSAVAAKDITRETAFAQDLDVDSLGLLTIATQVEERFGVTLDDSLIPTLPTVGALVDLVTSKKA